MREGRLVQIDTPEIIYQEPASRFVAEFVTQANFLSAHRHGLVWKTEIGSFAIANGSNHNSQNMFKDPTDKDDREGVVMIRQEDIMLEEVEDLGQFDVLTIRDRLFVGREMIYSLRTESGQDITVRSNTHIPIGSNVKLSVRSGCVKTFFYT
jgi:iron(III) transport system ATP-binding protein